jgi:hypothetical protein
MKKFIACLGLVFLMAGCGNVDEVVVDEVLVDETVANEAVVLEDVELTPDESDLLKEQTAELPWITYSGAYFDVDYLKSFSILEEGDDYASFVSDDGEVILAVYSPLWFGDASVVYPHDDETITDEKEAESIVEDSVIGGPATETSVWKTMVANDGSYTRILFDDQLASDDGTKIRKAFSIQYKNSDSYDKYKDEYLHFMDSLVQYAD